MAHLVSRPSIQFNSKLFGFHAVTWKTDAVTLRLIHFYFLLLYHFTAAPPINSHCACACLHPTVAKINRTQRLLKKPLSNYGGAPRGNLLELMENDGLAL